MTGTTAQDTRRERGQVLLLCAAAAVVVTVLLTWFAVTALGAVDGDSRTARTLVVFRVGAVAALAIAALLRFARWRLTDLPPNGFLAGSLLVLGAASLPHDGLPSPLAGSAHAVLAAVAVVLAGLALTVGTHDVPATNRRRWPLTGAVGVAAMATVLLLTPLAIGSDAGRRLVTSLVLSCAWFVVGLVAARRDGTQPWAGRVAPLFGSLGVVELMLGLDALQPDRWVLPAAALLASVAMVSAHAAYVDLVESLRAADRAQRAAEQTRVARAAPVEQAIPMVREDVDFDVVEIVASVAHAHARDGQEIRVRGGGGIARGRPGDLWLALEELLDNARRYAAGSPVTVQVLAIGTQVEVSVTDRGPGLSRSVADQVLTGGLGLEHARGLMRQNDGDLQLRNRIGGATFVLSLPAALLPFVRQTPVPLWQSAPRSA